MDHADQKYIDALLHNDEELLREVYKRFGNKIKSMVLQHGGNETDAADIIQDSLLSILNRAKNGGFKLTCPFEGFFYLVCKRKWIKELQRRNKQGVTISGKELLYTDDAYADLVEECMLYEDRKALFTHMLMQMGDKCRQLLTLSWEDRSMEEVAGLLNISYGYARKKKTDCMKKLIGLIHASPQYHSLK